MSGRAGPPQATIAMYGTVGLFLREHLTRVLDVFEANESLAPMSWGMEERESLPYARAEILAKLDGTPLSQVHLYLRRRRGVSYEASLALWERPNITLEVEQEMAAGQYAQLFDLADRLADVFHPDFGAAHVCVGLRPKKQLTLPWSNDDERDAELMLRAANPPPVRYYRTGPSGLAMRTYFGPHFSHQLGEALIEELPLSVQPLSWGGYRVDLIPEPWAADLPTLLQAWRAGMAHLQPAEILALPTIRNGRFVEFVKGPRTAIGGTIQ